jgi:hypothetical protein
MQISLEASKTANKFKGTTEQQTANSSAYIQTIDDFMNKVKKVGTLTEYNELINSFFGIIAVYTKSKIKGYEKNVSFTLAPPIMNATALPDTANSQTTSLMYMDYGGLVTDFKHTSNVKTLKAIKTSGATKITIPLGDVVSLDLGIDNAAIDRYKKDNAGLTITDFTKHVMEEASKDPESFLLQFISYTTTAPTITTKPEQMSGNGKLKGNQLLTITLKHPVPVSMGQPIFFTAASSAKTFKPVDLSNKTEQEISNTKVIYGTYALPDKIAGTYVVQKVTYEIDGKDKIVTQTLECER